MDVQHECEYQANYIKIQNQCVFLKTKRCASSVFFVGGVKYKIYLQINCRAKMLFLQ